MRESRHPLTDKESTLDHRADLIEFWRCDTSDASNGLPYHSRKRGALKIFKQTFTLWPDTPDIFLSGNGWSNARSQWAPSSRRTLSGDACS